ncbi:transglutaminase-like domain-containing protein [Acetivibrio straminisolvens]|uniref:transglutaminase-like domain-containing protein n=1 Tax=Acetivibrio straminisolvens TaxID=253314 RepID=UPI00138ADD10|nr:transglutaminase-like domain-containing protein [Acetivibrio straminisolvens]
MDATGDSMGEIAQQVKKIIAGITDEYEKAKAIADWLSLNMIYTYTANPEHLKHLPKWQYGTCETFASTTSAFYRLAGFPAKTVGGVAYGSGEWGAHAWNRVFVDGRWVHVDTTGGEFDLPIEVWSQNHKLTGVTDTDWDGTITVYDSSSREKIMTVGPVPIGTPFSKIPELANIKLSADAEGQYPVRPTDKFSSSYMKLYARTHRVSFEIQLDNAYKSLVPHYVREDEYGDPCAYVIVSEGAKLPQVKIPEKAGYTFIGWRDLNNSKAPIWNEYTDKVTKDMSFVAVFQKGTVNYTVSFNTNGGSAVKADDCPRLTLS